MTNLTLALPTLADLEETIARSFWDTVSALCQIEKRELYRPQYEKFAEYLAAKWAHICATESTWRQYRASYKAYLEAQGVGAILDNEYAARKLRETEVSARRLVASLAKRYSVDGIIKAADIARAADIVSEVLNTAALTGGLVDAGDGEMSALGAAVETVIQERILRQRQHTADGMAKNGWSAPMVVDRFGMDEGGGYARFALPTEWLFVQAGNKIELRWRIVEQEKTS